jgi:ABC-type uncharacterized transport system auxiliary subunit
MTTIVRYVCCPILALAGAVAFAACGTVQYASHYILDIGPASPAPARSPGALGPLVVRELGCPPYLCEGRVVYRQEPSQIGFYEYHRWAVDPRVTLTRLLTDRIGGSSLFESVTAAGSPARAAYLLRGEIERFEEVDDQTSVHAICTISAAVVEVATGTVRWSGNVSETVPVQKRDVAGVVVALGSASRIVADRLVASMTTGLSKGASPDPSGHQ